MTNRESAEELASDWESAVTPDISEPARTALVSRVAKALSQSATDTLSLVLDELRAERHKTETWKEKERAALSKAIARIEKLKATKGTDVEK